MTNQWDGAQKARGNIFESHVIFENRGVKENSLDVDDIIERMQWEPGSCND